MIPSLAEEACYAHWEIAPGLELQSNSSQDRCVPFPPRTPGSDVKKEAVDPCGSPVTRASASACPNEQLYLMLKTHTHKKTTNLLGLLSPVYFLAPPLGAVRGRRAALLSPAGVCSAMETRARCLATSPPQAQGMDPDLLALGPGPLWPGQASPPHRSGAEPGGSSCARTPRGASQNHPPGGNTSRPEQAPGWKSKKTRVV